MIFKRDQTTEIKITDYLLHTDVYTDIKQLLNADEGAQKTIEELEEAIEAVKEYRIQLAERCAQLATMAKHKKVSLIRKKSYGDSKVYYFIYTEQVYEDGTSEQMKFEKFEGKERHAAIKRFNEIKKKNPTYEFYEDIKKPCWE